MLFSPSCNALVLHVTLESHLESAENRLSHLIGPFSHNTRRIAQARPTQQWFGVHRTGGEHETLDRPRGRKLLVSYSTTISSSSRMMHAPPKCMPIANTRDWSCCLPGPLLLAPTRSFAPRRVAQVEVSGACETSKLLVYLTPRSQSNSISISDHHNLHLLCQVEIVKEDQITNMCNKLSKFRAETDTCVLGLGQLRIEENRWSRLRFAFFLSFEMPE